MKEVNNIKDTDGENVSQPKKVEGEDEEANFQAENSTNTETALIGSEEKPERKGDSAVEVKKEEEDNDKASGSEDLVGHGVGEVDNAKKEAETSATSEPAAEHICEELKNQPVVSNTPVPENEVVERPTEDFEQSSVQESESEASNKQAVSESVTEKAKGEVTEPSTLPSSISEEENKQKEQPIVSTAKALASDGIETLDTEKGAKNSQDENKNFEETVALDNLSAVVTDVAELQEAGEGVVSLEATDAPKMTDAELNANRDVKESAEEEMGSGKVEEVVKEVVVDAGKPDPSAIELVEAADESSVVKIAEDSMKPEAMVEEQKQEKVTEAEEPNLSKKSKIDTPVPQSEVVEKPKEDFEQSSVQESEAEASNKQAVSESVTEKVKGELTEPSTVPSSISEEENKQKEPPIVSTVKVPESDGIGTLGTEEGAKNSQDENKNFEEPVALENLSAVVTDVAQLQEAGKEAVALEATDAPQKTDAQLNASRDVEGSTEEEMGSGEVNEVVKEVAVDAGKPDPCDAIELVEAADESSIIKITEDSTKPKAKVEEQKQEKVTEAEEPNLSEKSKIDTASEVAEVAYEAEKDTGNTERVEEKKNDRLESNKPALVGTSEDLKVATEISEVSSEERRVYEGADMVEDKDENLKSKKETTRDHDAASIVAEASSKEEKASKEEMGSGKVEEMVKEVAVDAGKPDPSAAIELVEAADESSVIKIAEDSMKPEAKFEEQMQDKITEAEEPDLSEKSKLDTASEVAEVAYEGEKDSGSTKKVEEKKNDRLETNEPTLVDTSKDLKSATEISEVSSEERKVYEGADKVEDKDEHLKSKKETTRDLDAAPIVAEASSQEEKASKEEMGSGKVEEVVKEVAVDAGKPDPSAAIELIEAADESSVIKIAEDPMKPEAKVEEQKQEMTREAEEPDLSEKSKLNTASEVAEVAYEGEKDSGSTKKVEEKKNDRLETNEPTLVGTSKDLKSATEISEVSSEERKVYEGADMVEDKDEHLKSKKETTKDLDAAPIVSVASSQEEKASKEEMGSGKVKEVVKEVAVNAGKPDPSAAIELAEAADENSVIQIAEDSMKPDAEVEVQKQEKVVEAEEQNLCEKSIIDIASEVAEVAYEGEKDSGSTEKVEEKKNDRLESNKPTLVGTSKDLKSATEISVVSAEERKVYEGAGMVEDKDEHLKSKEELTRDLDAAPIVAEASSQGERTSKGAAVFEETNDAGLKDEKVSGLETSKDFDAASEVPEFSPQEKVSGILEIVEEKKEESLESDKTTSIDTSKSSDAAAVSSKDEKSSIAAEMVDKKDNILEGDKPTLAETSKDFDVVTDISGVLSVEEKTSGGTEMEKDEKEKSPEGTEMINEKKNEALEGARKTLGETFKEHDIAEKNVISASAAEPVADTEEIEKDKELAKDIAETGKPDDGNVVEHSKDGDVTKQDKEAPKQEVRKASPHHSSNILSKTKHLIVKAKKAILGKSPSSKTMSAGTKDDIKVK